MSAPAPRVLFAHGLEGSPQGTKARRLAAAFETRVPRMDTSDFEACVATQAEALRAFAPDVLVGSSFGGAVAVALLQRGHWRGPALLLAQAALARAADPGAVRLPGGVRVWLVHGRRDAIVPLEESRRLARSGSPERVRLVEVDDDHRLAASVARGDLERWVRELAAAERTGAGRAPAAGAPGTG